MKKKINIVILISIFILSIIVFLYYRPDIVLINHLPLVNVDFERLDYASNQDEAIKDTSDVKGRSVIYGGPYKVGDNIISQGMAVSVEKVGWTDFFNDNSKTEDDIGTAVFKLTISNYNYEPYEVKGEDIILIYNENKPTKFEQSIDKSGYDNWKYIKGSFKLGVVSSNIKREGYIFFPVQNEAKNGGYVRVYLNDIPIDFEY